MRWIFLAMLLLGSGCKSEAEKLNELQVQAANGRLRAIVIEQQMEAPGASYHLDSLSLELRRALLSAAAAEEEIDRILSP